MYSMNYLIIDAREPNEYKQSHVEGAVNLSSMQFMSGLPSQLADTPRDQPIIVYCRSGARSNTVAQILSMNGFTNVKNGINEGHVAQFLKNHR